MVSPAASEGIPASERCPKQADSDRTAIRTACDGMMDQARALEHMANRLDDRFCGALALVMQCTGRVIVSGMGKSGHMARKMAATLACTGTPAMFLHPGEAAHGDLGMVARNDVVLLVSNSGETDELVWLLPYFHELGVPIIAIVGDVDSAVARAADVVLDIGVERELCPHDMVPTTSALTTLAMGDALAMAAMRRRGFSRADVARVHPGAPTGSPSRRAGRDTDEVQ